MKEFGHIEFHGDGGVLFHVKVHCQLLAIEVVVVGKVVNEASELLLGIPVFPFEREEDVAGFPIPMKLVDVRIQRMVVGEFGWVSVIDLFWNSDRKTDSLVRARWDILERKRGAPLGCVEVGVLLGKLVPVSVI